VTGTYLRFLWQTAHERRKSCNQVPGPRLPSQPQVVSALWPVPIYSAWRTKLHLYEQLAQGCYLKAERPGIEPATFHWQVRRSDRYNTRLHIAVTHFDQKSSSGLTYGFYRAMLCICATSHGPVSVRPSVRHKSDFY